MLEILIERKFITRVCETFMLTSPSSDEPQGAPPSKKHRNDSESMLWARVDEIMKSGTDDIAVNDNDFPSSKAAIIVNTYLKEPNVPRHTCPLRYWKEKMSLWPVLGSLARKYLAAPCTTVPSERLFSSAVNIVTDKHSRLSPEKVMTSGHFCCV